MRLLALLAACVLAAGCSSAPRVGERLVETFQEIASRRDGDAQPDANGSLRLRMHAASNLNGGSEARPLALVVKLFHVRDLEAFQALPFDTFLDEASIETGPTGSVLASREVLLLPGQRYDVHEPLSPGATHLGIVALFRNPAGNRWRFVFDSSAIESQGLLVGLHACAMTTPSQALVTRLGSPSHTLSATACPH